MAKIHDLVDARSGEIKASYEQLLIGMQGSWLSFTFNMGMPAVARLHLHSQLADLLGAYDSLLRNKALEAVQSVHNQAELEAGAEQLTEPPLAMVAEAQAGLEQAARRDARGMQILANQALIRYQLAARRLPPALARSSALGELPAQGRDVFVQLDRMQRKRNSADFVVASARMAMFATYFQSSPAAAAAAGGESVVAVHPERGELELNLLSGYHGWAAENTHPNTRWHLQRKGKA